LDSESAVVLVLVPGGQAVLGCQSADPDAPYYDPQARPEEGPLTETRIDPYFLSKFELTQAQWSRLTGRPIAYVLGEADAQNPAARTWPALGMSAVWARTVLEAYGLSLPTSLAWEYAARAGTRPISRTRTFRTPLPNAIRKSQAPSSSAMARPASPAWAAIARTPSDCTTRPAMSPSGVGIAQRSA
jgi:formylglycine-generating enzyme required for sulfatase activity